MLLISQKVIEVYKCLASLTKNVSKDNAIPCANQAAIHPGQQVRTFQPNLSGTITTRL